MCECMCACAPLCLYACVRVRVCAATLIYSEWNWHCCHYYGQRQCMATFHVLVNFGNGKPHDNAIELSLNVAWFSTYPMRYMFCIISSCNFNIKLIGCDFDENETFLFYFRPWIFDLNLNFGFYFGEITMKAEQMTCALTDSDIRHTYTHTRIHIRQYSLLSFITWHIDSFKNICHIITLTAEHELRARERDKARKRET